MTLNQICLCLHLVQFLFKLGICESFLIYSCWFWTLDSSSFSIFRRSAYLHNSIIFRRMFLFCAIDSMKRINDQPLSVFDLYWSLYNNLFQIIGLYIMRSNNLTSFCYWYSNLLSGLFLISPRLIHWFDIPLSMLVLIGKELGDFQYKISKMRE